LRNSVLLFPLIVPLFLVIISLFFLFH
jgi:hypothetical protein